MKVSLSSIALALVAIAEAKNPKNKKLLKDSIVSSSRPNMVPIDPTDLVPFYIVLNNEVANSAHFIPLNPYEVDLKVLDSLANEQELSDGDSSVRILTTLPTMVQTTLTLSSKTTTARSLIRTMSSTKSSYPTGMNTLLTTKPTQTLSNVSRNHTSRILPMAAPSVTKPTNTPPTRVKLNATRSDMLYQSSEANDSKWRGVLTLVFGLASVGLIFVL